MADEQYVHPGGGLQTGQYLESEDGSVKVPALIFMPDVYKCVREELATYKWNDDDFLLATYPKNGTHFMWEIMTMLLRGEAAYVKDPKSVVMIDAYPVIQSLKVAPSPRVLNTHYRTDVLGPEFRKGKTVLVIRNPKDSCVSAYYHEIDIMSKLSPMFQSLANTKFSDYVKKFLYCNDMPYGNYFEYTEYMWTLREDPNLLVIFFEDMKKQPVETIEAVNEFMGTGRSAELVQEIADATTFDRMKIGKGSKEISAELSEVMHSADEKVGKESKNAMEALNQKLYRKGAVGDWENHASAAEKELFNTFLQNWKGGKDIPFRY